MGIKNTYCRIFATFMMLLYCFILTPVALWHSHTHPSAYNSHKHIKATHACIICEHAYTPYISQENTWLIAAPVHYVHLHQPTISTTCVDPLTHYHTRGSPTV